MSGYDAINDAIGVADGGTCTAPPLITRVPGGQMAFALTSLPDASALTFVNDRSERALPKMALGGKTQCQAALIDGNHGWPSVFVDFCYLNMMMDRDAILFVDDVHIYACEQLMLLLKSQPEYELLRLDKKMATFRKTSTAKFLPDWRGEPFIMANTISRRDLRAAQSDD